MDMASDLKSQRCTPANHQAQCNEAIINDLIITGKTWRTAGFHPQYILVLGGAGALLLEYPGSPTLDGRTRRLRNNSLQCLRRHAYFAPNIRGRRRESLTILV
jgi:hypothetical protein